MHILSSNILPVNKANIQFKAMCLKSALKVIFIRSITKMKTLSQLESKCQQLSTKKHKAAKEAKSCCHSTIQKVVASVRID